MKSKMMPKSDEDTNFYRKVSKYDIDRMNVDWVELNRERARQMTANAKTRKTEMDAKAQSGKTDGLLKKMMKINKHV